tara:strand:+ start:7717 stop:8409 length:693 start_codon:yes stop_codon:yes gene_type:complete
MIIGGSNNDYTAFGSLLLDNSDTYGTSGYFKATLKSGWMVQFNLLTENENYFTQSVDTALLDRLDFDDSPSGWWTEELDFSLYQEGDYISIDIDNESSQVGQFSIVIGGVRYTIDSPSNMNNEAKVWLREVWFFNEAAGIVKSSGEVILDPPLDPITIVEPTGEYPHSMFDCETGVEYTAENVSDHERMAALGYVHSMGECPIEEVEVSGFAMLSVLAVVGGVLVIALRR